MESPGFIKWMEKLNYAKETEENQMTNKEQFQELMKEKYGFKEFYTKTTFFCENFPEFSYSISKVPSVFFIDGIEQRKAIPFEDWFKKLKESFSEERQNQEFGEYLKKIRDINY